MKAIIHANHVRLLDQLLFIFELVSIIMGKLRDPDET